MKIALSVWPVQVRKKKKAGREEEKSQEVYISRMRGATLAGGCQPNLARFLLTDVIKRAKFHRYNARGFEAVRC